MTDEKSNLAIQQPFPLKERIWYYIFLMDFQMDTHYDTFLRLTIVLSTQIYHSFGKDFFREISIWFSTLCVYETLNSEHVIIMQEELLCNVLMKEC